MAWHWKPAICFSVNVRNCMCLVATLHLLNASCEKTQQILLHIFPDFISPTGGIISFNISGFSEKGQKAFKWIKIHLMKHSIKEIQEKNQTRVTVIQRGRKRGGGGGVLTEEPCPKDQPLTLCMYHFRQKRYPFCIPSSDKWYPFHIPNFELCCNCCNCCKYTIFTMWINPHIHKMHLWLISFWSLSYTSTMKTPSLSCTWSLKKVPLSGGASLFRPL